MYFKPSRKNHDFWFLPVLAKPASMKNDHLSYRRWDLVWFGSVGQFTVQEFLSIIIAILFSILSLVFNTFLPLLLLINFSKNCFHFSCISKKKCHIFSRFFLFTYIKGDGSFETQGLFGWIFGSFWGKLSKFGYLGTIITMYLKYLLRTSFNYEHDVFLRRNLTLDWIGYRG